MDALFDLSDSFDYLGHALDVHSLADGYVDGLAHALDGVDFASYSHDLIDMVNHIDPEHLNFLTDSGNSIFHAISPSDWESFSNGLDAHWIDAASLISHDFLNNADLGGVADAFHYIDPSSVADHLQSELSTIPDIFTKGITEIDWHSSLSSIDPSIMGHWIPEATDGTNILASIELFDHAADAIPTVFHEVGHHIAANFPDFYEQFAHIGSDAAPLWENMSGFLSSYAPSEWGHEAFAEAISYYNTQPEILANLAPEVYALIDSWWAEGAELVAAAAV